MNPWATGVHPNNEMHTLFDASLIITFEPPPPHPGPKYISFPTGGVRKVEDAGRRLQQVGAAGRQVSRDGHDGHAVATLLGADNTVVLRLTQAAVTGKESSGIRDNERKENWESERRRGGAEKTV